MGHRKSKSRNEAKNAVSQYQSPPKAEGGSSKAPVEPEEAPAQAIQNANQAENHQDKPKVEVNGKAEEAKVEEKPEAGNNLL